MAYERKTYDEWRVYCNYGEGYEEVYASEDKADAHARFVEYVHEDTYARNVKLAKKRVPKVS